MIIIGKFELNSNGVLNVFPLKLAKSIAEKEQLRKQRRGFRQLHPLHADTNSEPAKIADTAKGFDETTSTARRRSAVGNGVAELCVMNYAYRFSSRTIEISKSKGA